MPVGGRPTVRSRRLGAALRRHREAAGLDQATAAAAILRSVSKVSRLEGGQSTASALEVRTLLNCYGVDDPDERARLEGWAKTSNQRGWWLDYQETLRSGYTDHITLENDATYIRSWQPALIPGLLPDHRVRRGRHRFGADVHRGGAGGSAGAGAAGTPEADLRRCNPVRRSHLGTCDHLHGVHTCHRSPAVAPPA